MTIKENAVISDFYGMNNPIPQNSFSLSPRFPKGIEVKFEWKSCLGNAYLAAKETGDLMVEGVVIIFQNGKFQHAMCHVWNKSKEGHYYDVTKDYIWAAPQFKRNLSGEMSYTYIAIDEYPSSQTYKTIPDINNPNEKLLDLHNSYEEYIEEINRQNLHPFSVLMSVYRKDNPDHFRTSVESISVRQEYRPNEIIIVVDGPIPQDLDNELEKLCKEIPEIKTIRLEKNGGLGNALRIGMENVTNEWVMRMDADDISVPERFRLQWDYIQHNPEISVLGGQISEFIETPDNIVGFRNVPLSPDECREYYRDRDPLNHMTVSLNKSAVIQAGNYLPWHLDEDTYLWGRILKEGFKIANLPEILVNVRVGNEMYARRGGWKYFKSDVKILKWKLDNGLTSRKRYIYNYAVRFVVQVLMPNKIRGWVFKKLLRKH